MKRDFTILLILLLVLICIACSNAHAEPLCVMSVQASGGLHVRSAPDMESNVVYLLEDTETVIVLDQCGGWALVAKSSGDHRPIGWASMEYLK